MKQITKKLTRAIKRSEILSFLLSEKYAVSNKACSEEEKKIFDCWIKGGFQKIKLSKTATYFQPTELSKIFHDKKMEERFKLTLK